MKVFTKIGTVIDNVIEKVVGKVVGDVVLVCYVCPAFLVNTIKDEIKRKSKANH